MTREHAKLLEAKKFLEGWGIAARHIAALKESGCDEEEMLEILDAQSAALRVLGDDAKAVGVRAGYASAL